MNEDRLCNIEINRRYDIVSLYQDYGILIKNGKNFRCPHHEDISPSARLYDNVLYCFSERKQYTPVKVLKAFDPDRYKKIKKEIIKEIEKDKIEIIDKKNIDYSELEKFRKKIIGIDDIINYIRRIL